MDENAVNTARLLEIVFENSGIGICVISRDLTILWANTAMKKVFGELEGERCYQGLNKRDAACQPCGASEIFHAGVHRFIHEQAGYDCNGREVWSEIISLPYAWNEKQVSQVVKLMIPITERKQRELALTKRERHYSMIAEHVHDALYHHDFNGTIIDVNQQACAMLGYDRDELIGMPLSRIDSAEDIRLLPDRMRNLRQSGSLVFDGTHIRKDGSPVFVTVRAQVVSNECAGLVQSFVRDITESKVMEYELKTAQEHFKNQQQVLQQKTVALTEMMDHIEKERDILKKHVVHNIEKIIVPFLTRLNRRKSVVDNNHITFIQSAIQNIASSLGAKIGDTGTLLSPREIELCAMVKSGLKNKEIARVLSISLRTVETHRYIIRKKLGLAQNKINLVTYLRNS